MSAEPRFSTPIPARGPSGNIFAIMGTARSMMKQLRAAPAEIDAMSTRVMNAGSYDEALNVIREWFPVETADAP